MTEHESNCMSGHPRMQDVHRLKKIQEERLSFREHTISATSCGLTYVVCCMTAAPDEFGRHVWTASRTIWATSLTSEKVL